MGPKGLEWDGVVIRDDFGEDEFMIQMYVAPTLYNICIYIYIYISISTMLLTTWLG